MKRSTQFLLLLNRRQTRAIVIGALVFVLVGLFPPWHHVYINEVGHERTEPAGFHVITQHPLPLASANWYTARISVGILALEWLAVIAATAALVRSLRNRNDAEAHPFNRYRMRSP